VEARQLGVVSGGAVESRQLGVVSGGAVESRQLGVVSGGQWLSVVVPWSPPVAESPHADLIYATVLSFSQPRAPVAQLVEHETFNLRVTGSSPVRRMAKGPVV
jgi:hypothetical protein